MISRSSSVYADTRPVDEYQVKAAFLYNFANFVEWPAKAFQDSNDPLVIGILGNDNLADITDRMVRNKTVNGRKLVVKRFQKPKDICKCHILFLSSSEKNQQRTILKSLEGANTLTVGETDDFTRCGGMINLITESRVRLEINVAAARKCSLTISSKLLRLAKVVER